MNYFKLQVCCLIILIYIGILYFWESKLTKTNGNKFFEILLIMCPVAVVFDGLTAWTVNHPEVVSDTTNLALHYIFLIFENITLFLFFLYIHDITVGLPKNTNKKFLLFMPFLISTFLITFYMKDIYYVHGEYTNYSMGLPAYICYGSMFFHFSMILLIIIRHSYTLPSRKRIGIYSFMTIMALCFIAQIYWPEILISSILQTIFVIGAYINFEDPHIHFLEDQNRHTVEGFATIVENRDNQTGGHVKRTGNYVARLVNEVAKKPKYQHIFTKDYRKNIIEAAPLHDIGKVSTPDYILQKPSSLTPDEYEKMKEHAANGGDIILEIFGDTNNPDFMKVAYDVARYHHEWWDGSGYPEGLKGEEIPLHARIMAIADVFDAVLERRCYRGALPFEDCIDIIEKEAGTHFDPELSEIFVNMVRKDHQQKTGQSTIL